MYLAFLTAGLGGVRLPQRYTHCISARSENKDNTTVPRQIPPFLHALECPVVS